MDDVKIALTRIDAFLARTAEMLSHANAGRELPSHLLLSEEELKALDQFLDALAARLLMTPKPPEEIWLAPVRFAYRTGYGKNGPLGWLSAFYAGLRNARVFFQTFEEKPPVGSSVTNNYISIKDVVGPVNVLSRLDDVVQGITSSPSLSVASKEALAKLISELKIALGAVPATHTNEAELVSEQVEDVVNELERAEPRVAALKIKGSGLIEAARSLGAVAPIAIEVAQKIAAFVANPVG